MSRARRRWWAALGVLAIVAFAACELNPQPLPPLEGAAAADAGAAFGADGGRGRTPSEDEAAGPEDAASPLPNELPDGGDGGADAEIPDAGDAGDESDGGDADGG